MSDQCGGVTSRSRAYSHEDNACSPTEEQRAAHDVNRQQEAEREAETRRNEYYAAGGDEGGRCHRATSDASTYSPMLHDDPKLKDSRRTAACDPPLQDDKLGNALIGAVGGGVASGVRTAAAEALAGGGKSVIEHIATKTATGIVTGTAKQVAIETAKTTAENALKEASKPNARPASEAGSAPPTPAPAGRSGASGTSEVAPEPNQSTMPVPRPLVLQG